MKTIALEDIYADPHMLELLLVESESLEISRPGQVLGMLTPKKDLRPGKMPNRFDAGKHRTWFLESYGPDAYDSKRSVAELFEALRREPLSPRE